jgi:hypothetical protein
MPALIVLLVSAVIGGAYVVTVNALDRNKGGMNNLVALEKQIAAERAQGGVTAKTWRAYADALVDAREFAKAALAFQEVLQLEPRNQDAKFQRGLALAQAGAGDALYQFQKDLVYSEPKLAVSIFERSEVQRFLTEERFSSLAKEAKHQAMD